MKATSRANGHWLVWSAIAALSALALWLRLRNLTAWPMWLDEAYSAFASENGVRFIWTTGLTYETHPPLYYSVLSQWAAFVGTDNWTYRLLGVIIGSGTLALLWAGGRELARQAGTRPVITGLAALALGATAPGLIDMARLVRPYYMILFANALGCWALLRLARGSQEKGNLPRGAWYGYLVALALLCWLHSLGALYAAALGLGLIISIGPQTLLQQHRTRFLVGHLAVGAVTVPVLLILLDQAPTWAQSTWLRFSWDDVIARTPIVLGVPNQLGVLLLALLWALAAKALGRESMRVWIALVLVAFVPLVLSILLSVVATPVFLPRTLIGCAIPALLLMALGGSNALVPRAALAVQCALALHHAIVSQALPSLEDWNGTVHFLKANMRPEDGIQAYPNEGGLALRFALREQGFKAEVRDLPGPVPARDPQGWYPAGNRAAQSLKPERLRQLSTDSKSRKAGTIWLVRFNPGFYDPEGTALRIYGESRDIASRFKSGDIDVTGFRQRASTQPAPPKQP